MKVLPRQLIAGLGTVILAGSLPLLVTQSALAAPAWEPDPNALGTITFYDSAGHVVTHGSDLSHIADYAAANTDGTSGATKATLIFANPEPNKPTATWYVASASPSTTYPNSSAPAPIQGPGYTKPVVTLGAADGDLAAFIGGAKPNTQAGYANTYQVRVKDSGPNGVSSGDNYWVADVTVNQQAGTWTELFPTNAGGGTTKSLANTAKPVVAGTHRVGHTQTCKPGSWSPAASSYKFAWFVGSSRINGASGKTFTPKKSLAGKQLSCMVSASKSGYKSASAHSAKVTIHK